ncbi:MAG: hypothetical protein E6767_13010 [Dysgonomonas sp.]|nr:hypothetical protein [Dysgonomonas sp.]
MYKYFTQNSSIYKSKRINYFNWGSLIFFLLFAAYLFIFHRDSQYPYWAFALLGAAINLGICTHQIVIDMDKKTISTSYLGINKKEYPLIAFSRFGVVHNKAYGIIGDGYDIHMLFNIGGKEETLMLYNRLYGKNRVPKIIEEIKQIIER